MSESKIVLKDINSINLAPYNPRKMDENEMGKLMRSLKEFGFVDPVIVNKNNTVIGGHQRINAWKRMGETKVPCVFVDMSIEKEKALNIALNKISGEWDNKKLSTLLDEINTSNLNIDLTGFDDDELKKILGNSKDLEIIIGENDKEDNFDIEYIPQANIKMLQLYFSMEDYELVTGLAAKLMMKLKKENITDVVKEAIVNESKRQKINNE
jgi:hypothetical protein